MMKLLTLSLLFLACGRVAEDVDAAVVDASYDYNLASHWGECCDRKVGGLGRPCTASELEAGPEVFVQCSAGAQYCGIEPPDPSHAFPGRITCCGHGSVPSDAPSGFAVEDGCPPWPGGVEASWGDCCYSDPGKLSGGVIGPCTDASSPHVQCSSNQYCGPFFVDAGASRCCGDRSKDQGTLEQSGLDVACMPKYWLL